MQLEQSAKLDILKLFRVITCDHLSLVIRVSKGFRTLVSVSSTKLVNSDIGKSFRTRQCNEPASILLSTRNFELCKTSYNEIFHSIHSLCHASFFHLSIFIFCLFIQITPTNQSLFLSLSLRSEQRRGQTHTYYLVKPIYTWASENSIIVIRDVFF